MIVIVIMTNFKQMKNLLFLKMKTVNKMKMMIKIIKVAVAKIKVKPRFL